MKQWIDNISDYLLRHSWWVFFTVILFISNLFMQMSAKLTGRVYLGLIVGLSLAYIIPLLFARFREGIKSKWSQSTYWLLWSVAFVVTPVVLWLLNVTLNDLPFNVDLLATDHFANQWGVAETGVTLLLTEGLIGISNRKTRDREGPHWINRLSVPALALGVITLFALVLVPSNNFVMAESKTYSGWERIGFFALVTLEVVLIYLSYYLIYYLHHHLLYRKLLQEKGMFYYLMGAVASFLLLSPVYTFLIAQLPLVASLKLHSVGLQPKIFADENYAIPLMVFIVSLPFIMLQEWYRRRNAITELEKEKTATELDLLKQQINPHFFFNTLNNLYAMSLTQDEETPETILKLSELMRYVIYQGQQKTVTLGAEIKYLRDYLDLQEIRLHQQANIDFRVKTLDESIMIPPLLFIILLENAFKHGIEPAEETAFLEVELTVDEQRLIFLCRNSVEGSPSEKMPPGIGLQNLRRRLELLYPNGHQLSLQPGQHEYTATLSLEL